MKILYAEDELSLAKAVKVVLEHNQIEVVHVENGAKAIEAINSQLFDVIVLDIMMPVMSGLEVLEYLRKEKNNTPVLLLTAKSTTDDKISGLSTGADDYLTKPFEIKELIARINSLARRNEEYHETAFTIGNTTFDTATNNLSTESGTTILNPAESALFHYFAKHLNEKVELSKNTDKIHPEIQDEYTFRIYISFLMKQLEYIKSNIVIQNIDNAHTVYGADIIE